MEVIFEKGDVISSLDKTEIRVITKVNSKKQIYKFLNLKEQRIKGIFNSEMVIGKGDKCSQPMYMVHKYFSILEL